MPRCFATRGRFLGIEAFLADVDGVLQERDIEAIGGEV
jgi:hypothetical protein